MEWVPAEDEEQWMERTKGIYQHRFRDSNHQHVREHYESPTVVLTWTRAPA